MSDATDYWSSDQTWRYLFNHDTDFKTEYFPPGVLIGLDDSAVNGSLWSLAIEVRLYLNDLLDCMVALIFAAVSWHLIDSPVLRLKNRFRLSPEKTNAVNFKNYAK